MTKCRVHQRPAPAPLCGQAMPALTCSIPRAQTTSIGCGLASVGGITARAAAPTATPAACCACCGATLRCASPCDVVSNLQTAF